jgi:hypothetical protein
LTEGSDRRVPPPYRSITVRDQPDLMAARSSAAMRGKRMVLDDRECRAEREILRWGKVLTLP